MAKANASEVKLSKREQLDALKASLRTFEVGVTVTFIGAVIVDAFDEKEASTIAQETGFSLLSGNVCFDEYDTQVELDDAPKLIKRIDE